MNHATPYRSTPGMSAAWLPSCWCWASSMQAEMNAPGQLPDDHLILDQVTQQLATTFQLLSGDPDEAAERALAEIGVDTRTEAALLGEIAAAGPLAHPDRFEQSHRLVMRALEVLDRDGWKHPVLRRLGPLSGAASGAVQFVARTIVRGHVSNVVHSLSRLYARRESQSQTNSPERRMLARARIQADRLALGYKGGSLPLADRADRRRSGAGAGFDRAPVRRGQGPGTGAGGASGRDPGDRVRRAGVGAAAGRRSRPPPHQGDARPVAGGAVRDDRPLRQPAPGRQRGDRVGRDRTDGAGLVRRADRDRDHRGVPVAAGSPLNR